MEVPRGLENLVRSEDHASISDTPIKARTVAWNHPCTNKCTDPHLTPASP